MSGSTQYDYVDIPDFSGGLNTKDSPIELAPNQLQVALNGVLTRRGAFVKRKGMEKDLEIAAQIAADVTGVNNLYRFYKPTSSQTIVACNTYSNIKLYLQGSASYTEITGGSNLTPGADIVFKDYRGWLLISDGDTFQAYTSGTTKADVAYDDVTVVPDLLEISDDRVWAVDRGLGVDTLYYTALDGWATDPTTDIDFVLSNDITIPDRSSDKRGITNLWSYGNNDELLVFRENDVYALLGSDEDNYTLVKMSDSAGCVSSKGIAATDEGDLIIVGNGTIYELRGSTFTDIGRPIGDMIEGVNMRTAACVYDQYRECVYIGYEGGTLVWNIPTRAWTTFDRKFSSAVRYRASADNNKIVIGFTDSAHPWHFYRTNKDSTSDIPIKIQTKLFDLGAFYQEKFFRGIKTLTDANKTTPYTISISLNDGLKLDSKTMTITLIGSLWDTMVWDTDAWAGDNLANGAVTWDVQKRGNEFSVLIEDTSDKDLGLYKMAMMFMPLAYNMEE